MLVVADLYHFTRFPDPARLRDCLQEVCEAAAVKGTILLAPEGINGTIAGRPEAIDTVIARIRALPGCADLRLSVSATDIMPFKRLKVRLKREIVTMGQPDVDPAQAVGRYVEPEAWNALIAAPDVALIDTRNDYEVAIGSFAGAVDPGTRSFREFPDWWKANAERFQGKRVAMFCTGGIRCEKSTNWLIGQGVREVFHLKGGILNYLEAVPETQSLWQGDCFVFDGRVSVGQGRKRGTFGTCHACRRPLAPEDRTHEDYEAGVRCHRCSHEHSDADRARFRERHRQFRLAAARRDPEDG